MCSGTNCPLREKCYRFTAKADNHYQSWFVEIPGNWEKTDDSDEPIFICEMFWGDRNESIMNKLNEIMR